MGQKLKSPAENSEGAIQHPHVLVNLNRVVETYNTSQPSFINTSRTGVTPKSHQCINEWRLIIDLLHKESHHNEGIAKPYSTPHCVFVAHSCSRKPAKILEYH